MDQDEMLAELVGWKIIGVAHHPRTTGSVYLLLENADGGRKEAAIWNSCGDPAITIETNAARFRAEVKS